MKYELIQNTLLDVFSILNNFSKLDSYQDYTLLKGKNSSKNIAEKLKIPESRLGDFEEALRQFFQFKGNPEKARISFFRISLWLETICKNLNIDFKIDDAISNEELAIKQVRALELILRDLVNDTNGGSDNVLKKLNELFKYEVVEKWLKNADETGVLSGTTFSELSSIFLDKNIFKSVEDIFENSAITISKTSRESLRFILDDIRLIRNSIAHNKKISTIQIAALNEYYGTISSMIKESKSNSINPDLYLDLDKAKMDSFLSGLKEDGRTISAGIEDVKTDLKAVKSDTGTIRKRSSLMIAGIVFIILVTGTILFFVSRQSGTTTEMGQDIKDVKEIVSGDAEIKNMSSTDDLSATKELNERTKDKNAKRVAILYFDNSGGEASMDKLKKGLADMMITDLSNIHMLDIVERDKLESILKEQKLNNSKEFDPSTASKVGKLLGAQIILTGGYFEMMGALRIDARFIDVETGKILKSDGVDGQTSSFFKIQKQLSWKIIKNMDTKISDQERSALEMKEKTKALSINDLNDYSKALDLYDSGKKADAKKIAITLQQKYPDFEPVINLVKKL